MPVYEYQCKKCGHIFEVITIMADEELKPCTKCGTGSTKKILSQTGKPVVHGYSAENSYSKQE